MQQDSGRFLQPGIEEYVCLTEQHLAELPNIAELGGFTYVIEQWNNNRKALWDASYTCGKGDPGKVDCPYNDFFRCYEYQIMAVPSEGEPGYEAWDAMRIQTQSNDQEFTMALGAKGRICNTEQGMEDLIEYFGDIYGFTASSYPVDLGVRVG